MSMVTRRTSIDARIARAGSTSFPIVSRSELRQAGVERHAIRRRLQDGRLSELWPDMFAVGCMPDHLHRDAMAYAGVLASGPHSALSHTSALSRRGLWSRHDGTIHVSSVQHHRNLPAFDVRYHRRLDPGTFNDANIVRCVATDSALQACQDAAALLTPHQLAAVIREATYAREFGIQTLELEIARRAGHRGTARLRRAIQLIRSGSAGTRSASEDELLRHVTPAFGEPFVNVRSAAGIPDYEPDFLWPRARVIVEVDGDQHLEDHDRARDEARDAALRQLGWTVIRVPYRQVWTALASVLRRIAQAFKS